MNQSRGSSALMEIARSTRDLYAAAYSDLPLACRSQLGLAMRSLAKPPAASPFAMQQALADKWEPAAAKEMVWGLISQPGRELPDIRNAKLAQWQGAAESLRVNTR